MDQGHSLIACLVDLEDRPRPLTVVGLALPEVMVLPEDLVEGTGLLLEALSQDMEALSQGLEVPSQGLEAPSQGMEEVCRVDLVLLEDHLALRGKCLFLLYI